MSASRDFLVEIGTEELPPKSLLNLSAAFAEGVAKGLKDAGVAYKSLEAFATPRRLAWTAPPNPMAWKFASPPTTARCGSVSRFSTGSYLGATFRRSLGFQATRLTHSATRRQLTIMLGASSASEHRDPDES